MNGKNMEPSHNNPYDLLYQLGVSANYKGFFHAAHAVTLCMQQQESPPAGDEMALPRRCQTLRNKLESCGAKYSNRRCRCMGTEPSPVGSTCSKAS